MTVTWSIQHIPSTKSTQDCLKEKQDLSEGDVVYSDVQTAGYGRHSRDWESAAGNLFFSFCLQPKCSLDKLGQLSLLIGLSVKQAIGDRLNAPMVLKWPNDIMISGKKCCGILLETVNTNTVVAGVGINIASSPMETSTCLNYHADKPIEPRACLEDVLNKVSANYTRWKEQGFDGFRQEWLNCTYRKGIKMSVNTRNEMKAGSFQDIDELGNLILGCENTGHDIKITSGDVWIKE